MNNPKETQKLYQLTLFLSSLTEEKKAKEIIQKIIELITHKGGSVEKSPNFEVGQKDEKAALLAGFKKNLSYPIKKQQTVFCFDINFFLDSQSTEEINKYLNSEKEIIRYMITSSKPLSAAPEEPVDYKIDEKIESLIDKEIPLVQTEKNKLEEEPKSLDKSLRENLSEEIPQTEPKPDKKVKIEELDKKLEEILNQ